MHRGPRGAVLVIVGLTTLLVVEAIVRLPQYGTAWLGHDFRLYMDATRDWLASGSYYRDYQLAGPYPVAATEILYPPIALVLFVPFTVLPAPAWWAVPLGAVGWVLWRQRPSLTRWVVILSLLAFPIEDGTSWAVEFIGNGNPGIWEAAIVALATRFPVFGSWALIKPSLFPFAVVGIRSRTWWAGLAALAVASAHFGPMWIDYIAVLSNAQGVGPLYSLPNVTLCLVPLVALIRNPGTRLACRAMCQSVPSATSTPMASQPSGSARSPGSRAEARIPPR